MSWGRRWGLGGPAQCHQARGTALPGSRIHWPAGRRPPHAGLRPEQEEGGGETERDRVAGGS